MVLLPKWLSGMAGNMGFYCHWLYFCVLLRKIYPVDVLRNHMEALIFTASQPIKLTEMKQVLEEAFGTVFMEDYLVAQIAEIAEKYQDSAFPFEIREINEGYVFLTKPEYKETLTAYLKHHERKKLSPASLEVLAIIAYRQPVTRHEIEEIRGVSSDYLIHKLLEKELISIGGRSDGPGRPLLYQTSERFLNHFGMKSLTDLPKLKEFAEPKEVIGSPDPTLEN
jgi:segregation and condensation protein B